MNTLRKNNHLSWRTPLWIGLSAFVLLTVLFKWDDDSVRLIEVLPYLFFLACPLMHVFMHRGHGGHAKHEEPEGNEGLDEIVRKYTAQTPVFTPPSDARGEKKQRSMSNGPKSILMGWEGTDND